MDREILSVLLGLIGACESNPKTLQTDGVVLRALTAPCESDAARRAVIGDLRAEKAAVAPGCAQCAMPCGNTSDFDLSQLESAPAEIRALKERLIEQVRQKASVLARQEKPDCEKIYRALSALRYDTERERLLTLIEALSY